MRSGLTGPRTAGQSRLVMAALVTDADAQRENERDERDAQGWETVRRLQRVLSRAAIRRKCAFTITEHRPTAVEQHSDRVPAWSIQRRRAAGSIRFQRFSTMFRCRDRCRLIRERTPHCLRWMQTKRDMSVLSLAVGHLHMFRTALGRAGQCFQVRDRGPTHSCLHPELSLQAIDDLFEVCLAGRTYHRAVGSHASPPGRAAHPQDARSAADHGPPD